MPTPREGESKKKFVSRCIAYLFDNEGETDRAHAAAKCYGMYDQWRKKHGGSKRTQAMGERDIDYRSNPQHNPLMDEDEK
jgi:hypothetical protein